jgi:CheY-like chemotaxis protein
MTADPSPLCKVLIADDDAMNRLVAVESLKYLHADATAVDSGAEVLRQLAEQHFDLLLLDVHMPDMSGIETALRIRQHEQSTGSPHLPILALTASATDKDRQSCLDAGMDGVLTKPFHISDLGEVLRRWGPAARPS